MSKNNNKNNNKSSQQPKTKHPKAAPPKKKPTGSKPGSAAPVPERKPVPGKYILVAPRAEQTLSNAARHEKIHAELVKSASSTSRNAGPVKYTLASHGGAQFVHAPAGTQAFMAAHRDSPIRFSGKSYKASGAPGFQRAGGEMNRLINESASALVAWGETVAKPFGPVKTVLPPSEINGLALMDPYCKENFGSCVASGIADACVSMQFDNWYDNAGGAAGDWSLLSPNASGQGVVALTTAAGNNDAFFPPVSYAPTVARPGIRLGSVDPNIKASSAAGQHDGTEFAQVSGGLRLMAVSTTCSDGFQGEVWRFETLDAVNDPVTGTFETLRAKAAVPNSNLLATRFKLTEDGLFVGPDGAVSSFVEAAGLPTSSDSWRTHWVGPAANVIQTLNFPQAGFYARAVATGGNVDATAFDVSTVSNYAIERYPSARVGSVLNLPQVGVSEMVGYMDSLSSMVGQWATNGGRPISQAAALSSMASNNPGWSETMWNAMKQYGPGLLQELVPEGWAPALGGAVIEWLGAGGKQGALSLPAIAQGSSSSFVELLEEGAEEALEVGEAVLPFLLTG